jgi:3-dehydroquinate synthetase
LVLYDIDTLKTLTEREWRGGMAEVIKHAIIGNPQLFSQLQTTPQPTFGEPVTVEDMIAQASAVKIAIVQSDEREAGLRMHLNLGHTVGHAIEQASHYLLNHGESVALGLRIEAEIAVAKNWLEPVIRDQIIAVLRQHHLPVSPPNLNWEQVVAYLEVDKKHSGKGWTFVLPREIGRVEVTREITQNDVLNAWRASIA